MNVLCDFIGHADLYYSMHALFQKRLGWNLYRPFGGQLSPENKFDSEWEKHGIVTMHLADPSWPYVKCDDEYRPNIVTHDYEQRCISFDKFMSTDIDVVICTSWQHEVALHAFTKRFKPKARFIRQIANVAEQPMIAKDVMLAMTTQMRPGTNWIKYHPEPAPRYHFVELPPDNNKIKSFFNYMKNVTPDRNMWLDMKQSMPDFTFKHHGGESDDGSVPHIDLHVEMKDSKFIWHTKPHGGCGFTLREALACGRPIICNSVYSRKYSTLARDHMIDGLNCIDLNPELRSLQQNMTLIREWAKPGVYEQKCKDVLSTFETHINYKVEAEAIKAWIEKI